MKNILLDTNTYTSFLSGDQIIFDMLSSADRVYISIIVLGELYAGFKGGTKEIENKKRLNQFLNKPSVKILNATSETSEIFGRIKYELKIAGTPIPINDVWIAAHAFETGTLLVTYDKHFKKIPGLQCWDHIGE